MTMAIRVVDKLAELSDVDFPSFADGEVAVWDAAAGKFKGVAQAGGGGVSVLHVNTTPVGNVLGGEDDLMTYSLPANTLSANGKGVRIWAWGTTSATTTSWKVRRLYFGATALQVHTAPTDSPLLWEVIAVIVRTGAATQEARVSGTLSSSNTQVEFATPGELLSSPVLIRLTGESQPKGVDPPVTNDVIARGLIVELLP